MTDRDKHEAQTRMAIGAARVLMKQGKDGRESLEVMKEHFAIVDALETEASSVNNDTPIVNHDGALKQS